MRHFKIQPLAFAVGVVLFLSSAAFSQTTIVELDPGSYSTARPESCKPLPQKIFKLGSLEGPTPTNQWWSSLVWEEFSSNMFPHPMGVLACENGLSVCFPGSGLVGADNAIMGGGVSSNGDVVIGLKGAKFSDARLADQSGWMITAEFASDSGKLQTMFGHGSPFVYCSKDKGSFQLRFAEPPMLWAGDEKSPVIGISVRGSHYGLFAAEGSRWVIENDKSVSLDSEDDQLTVALLPDKSLKTFEQFEAVANNRPSETSFDYTVENGQLVTTWKVETEGSAATSSDEPQTVMALYPHQWKYSEVQPTRTIYKSVRGNMRLFAGNEFTTRIPIQGVLPFLPPQGIPDKNVVLKHVDEIISQASPAFGDTYWEGKHLGKLASLSGICEALGEVERQNQIIAEIKRRLENWFVASEGEDAPMFYYNKTWGTLIGSRPSYGSDDQINDHHFHYGYFIRAAAEVARVDSKWAEKWSPMVEFVIADIASPSANSFFPQLRGFDPFAGHSWASGHARFGDGNNLESSSESMNASYGMMLWGEATGKETIRDLGAFLFNTERTAIEEYWMDVSGTNFPDKFPKTALGMVWGGKGAYATWFSGDVDHIHGINWLPMTPASLYLGRNADYVKRNYAEVLKDRKNGKDLNKGWGDLLVMYGAMADPTKAVSYIDENPNCNVEGGNSRAFMYHWIHTLDQLGRVDASITADHLFANVFVRDGKKTYVAYNFRNEPLTVAFSDGKEIKSMSRGIVVEN